MSIFKIIRNSTIKQVTNNIIPKRTMFECDEEEPFCSGNKCKKKKAPCPRLPVKAPPLIEKKDWAEEKECWEDRILPKKPKKRCSDPKICGTVPQLAGETSNKKVVKTCCLIDAEANPEKCKKMKLRREKKCKTKDPCPQDR